MLRKLVALIVGMVLITTGSIWYITIHNRPEAVMRRFTTDLAQAGDTEKTYNLLSPALTKDRESYWHAHLAQFKGADVPPTLLSQEPIKDTFNTYTEQEDPHRFVYAVNMKNERYRLTVITIKHGLVWQVDELHAVSLR